MIASKIQQLKYIDNLVAACQNAPYLKTPKPGSWIW